MNSVDLIIPSVLVALCLAALTVGVLMNFSGFSQQLKYLNNEIQRTSGEERKHYVKKKRKLILSLFFGRNKKF